MEKVDITQMVGVEVKHIRFGKGIVSKVEGNYFCIDFGNLGIKKFQYPDSFEKFLDVENKKMKTQIASDLEARKKEEDYLNRNKTQEVYDNLKQFEKRKAAEHERKVKLQLEKQRQAQIMREQRMKNGNHRNFSFTK